MLFRSKLIKFFSKKNIENYSVYKVFKKKNKESNIILKITNQLSNLKFYKNNLIEEFFIPEKNNLDKSISQYLAANIYIKVLNKKIISSFRQKVSLPLEKEVYLKLTNFINIKKYSSFILFALFVLKEFFFGFSYFFLKLLEYITKYFYFRTKLNNSAYFISLLNHQCLTDDNRNYNIYNWFKNFNSDNKKNINFYFHNIKIKSIDENKKYLKSPVNILEFKTFVFFLLFGSLLIFVSFISLFFLRWKLALLSKDILSKLIIQNTSSKYCFKEYLFNNSSWIYKPLWVDEVEKKGSKVIMYFYSMNIENIKKNSESIHLTDSFWNLCTWKNYYVWNIEHKNILNNFIKFVPAKIEIVGPIPYSDTSFNYNLFGDNEKKKIAIFDISLYRKSIRIYFNTVQEFYTYKTTKKFISDILKLADKKEFTFYLKLKRHNSNFFDKNYINLIDSLKEIDNLKIIDPEISAFKLTEFCDAAISLPFTSTAQVFKLKNKTSFYYDPISFFDKQHAAARGINILYYEDLKKWINNL